MEKKVSAEDTHGIFDLIGRYVWIMDTTNGDGIVDCFTPDGVVHDPLGVVWDQAAGGPRAFIDKWLLPAWQRRGQHMLRFNRVRRGDDGFIATSYYAFGRWNLAAGGPQILTLGMYIDTCVRSGDKWLLKEKIIRRWNTDTLPGIFDALNERELLSVDRAGDEYGDQ